MYTPQHDLRPKVFPLDSRGASLHIVAQNTTIHTAPDRHNTVATTRQKLANTACGQQLKKLTVEFLLRSYAAVTARARSNYGTFLIIFLRQNPDPEFFSAEGAMY